jgi:hypothetical protein
MKQGEHQQYSKEQTPPPQSKKEVQVVQERYLWQYR